MRSSTLLAILLIVVPALAGCADNATDDGATDTPTTPPDAGTTPTPETGTSTACERDALVLASGQRADGNGASVTLLSHDSFTMTDELVQAFENESGYQLEVVKLGDAGEALNKAILQKDSPVGDVFFGVDNNLIHRAVEHDLFAPYVSPRLADVPDRFVEPFCTGATLHATPVSYGYVNLNYDPAALEARGVAPPDELRDLASATYAPLTVVENPHTSSPGLAFLLATVDTFGTEGDYTYQDFWRDFAQNGGEITPGWEEAYGSWFTQGWDEAGARDRPIVVSYSTSPAFNPMMGYTEEATSANLDLAGSAWLQIEAAAPLKNAQNPEGARALVDFLLSRTFQEDIPMLFSTYPVHPDAEVPEAYALYADEPEAPASLPAAEVEQNKDAWLAGWSDATGQA